MKNKKPDLFLLKKLTHSIMQTVFTDSSIRITHGSMIITGTRNTFTQVSISYHYCPSEAWCTGLQEKIQ